MNNCNMEACIIQQMKIKTCITYTARIHKQKNLVNRQMRAENSASQQSNQMKLNQ